MTGTELGSTKDKPMTHGTRVERAGEIAMEAASRHPGAGEWGLFAFDDRAAVYCGAGTGCFLWFGSEAEMGDFLAHQLPFFVDAELGEQESLALALALAQELAALGRAWEAESISLSERILALNTRLRHMVQVEWAGPVMELLEGNGKPEAFRAWYREVAGIEVDSSPIPAAQQEAFFEALAEYGV